ncbi:pyridoxal-phosphate dependent enzyme [Rhodobacteraceae bacterium B1Z28]|uniref:Pyridoxal-phosphate dependent enzyme n=1 Tax=Ruegeria haliotis TaxID=2747601 RepID=A0ABX2PYE7_9RHOB|nr:pyridoxal-phosphate dependent enzyme [Ruegeria haliotis]NVO58341.1 pyridoxal-phosphate dependent enzyme [Ruegeria haliotis]
MTQTPLVADKYNSDGRVTCWIKNEGKRFADEGLSCFKALGVLGVLAAKPDLANANRFVCASDGNHGRAVAWAAERLGVAATIYMPASVPQESFDRIMQFGARVVAVEGGYDRAIAAAAEDAQKTGAVEFSDTGRAGFEEIPYLTLFGYGRIVDEILKQLPSPPTHVLVPAGVGALAAGVAARFATRLGVQMPRIITVEPLHMAPIAASLQAGDLRSVPEGATTSMSCLACETPSNVAWDLLRDRLFGAMAISDLAALKAMNDLRSSHATSEVLTQQSGAAAFAGLQEIFSDSGLRTRAGLDGVANVVSLVTEGPSLASG